jgi:hypothetical protein
MWNTLESSRNFSATFFTNKDDSSDSTNTNIKNLEFLKPGSVFSIPSSSILNPLKKFIEQTFPAFTHHITLQVPFYTGGQKDQDKDNIFQFKTWSFAQLENKEFVDAIHMGFRPQSISSSPASSSSSSYAKLNMTHHWTTRQFLCYKNKDHESKIDPKTRMEIVQAIDMLFNYKQCEEHKLQQRIETSKQICYYDENDKMKYYPLQPPSDDYDPTKHNFEWDRLGNMTGKYEIWNGCRIISSSGGGGDNNTSPEIEPICTHDHHSRFWI